MAIGLNGRPTDPKPLHRSKPNLTQLITLGYSSMAQTHHKTIKGAWPTNGQYISFQLVFFFFHLFVSCHCAQQKPLGRFRRFACQTTRLHASKCLLGILTLPKTSKGSFSQKTPQRVGFKLKRKQE
jgi:hypothetical protein